MRVGTASNESLIHLDRSRATGVSQWQRAKWFRRSHTKGTQPRSAVAIDRRDQRVADSVIGSKMSTPRWRGSALTPTSAGLHVRSTASESRRDAGVHSPNDVTVDDGP